MTDRFNLAKIDISLNDFSFLTNMYAEKIVRCDTLQILQSSYDALMEALTLATESEQLRKRLAELETLLAQANNKIKWYERTEATND